MRGTIEGNEARVDTDDDAGWDQPVGLRRRPEQWLIAALVVVVLLAIALLGFRSRADEDDDPAGRASGEEAATSTARPTTAAPATSAPPTTDAPATPAAPGPPATPTPSPEPTGATLEDGRHPVYVTAVGGSGATVQFDLIQWLTDDAADEYVEDHPDQYPGMYEEEGGYPYDALVVNDNPRLRRLPVVDGATAVVLYGEAADDWAIVNRTIPVGDLPAYFAAHQTADDRKLSASVFWLDIEDGRITSIEEQFQS